MCELCEFRDLTSVRRVSFLKGPKGIFYQLLHKIHIFTKWIITNFPCTRGRAPTRVTFSSTTRVWQYGIVTHMVLSWHRQVAGGRRPGRVRDHGRASENARTTYSIEEVHIYIYIVPSCRNWRLASALIKFQFRFSNYGTGSK